MSDLFKDWIEKIKLNAKLISEGKSSEEALREAWGNEEAEKVLADIKEIEQTIIKNN